MHVTKTITIETDKRIEDMWPEIERHVTAFVYNRTRSSDVAKDIAQETFIRFWKNRTKVAGIENPEAWCMTVAKNLIIDRGRKRSKVTDMEFVPTDTLSTGEKSSLELLHERDLVSMVKILVSKLPDDQRNCIILRDMEGKSYQEVSEQLNISIHAVKVNIHRGRKYIKNHLEKLNTYEQVQ